MALRTRGSAVGVPGRLVTTRKMARRAGRRMTSRFLFSLTLSISSTGTPLTSSAWPEARAANRVDGSVMNFISTFLIGGAPFPVGGVGFQLQVGPLDVLGHLVSAGADGGDPDIAFGA